MVNWQNTLYYMNKLNLRAEPPLKVAFKKITTKYWKCLRNMTQNNTNDDENSPNINDFKNYTTYTRIA